MSWPKLNSVCFAVLLALLPHSVSENVCAQRIDHDFTTNQVRDKQKADYATRVTNRVDSGLFEQSQPHGNEEEVEKVVAAAKSVGLEGRWIVLSVENSGELSKAQIGQQPNDVISITRGENNRGPFSFG